MLKRSSLLSRENIVWMSAWGIVGLCNSRVDWEVHLTWVYVHSSISETYLV